MSRQSEARERLGYNPKPLARCCRTCVKLESETIQPDINKYPYWFKEKMSCGIGGFAVKAQAVCDSWGKKEEEG